VRHVTRSLDVSRRLIRDIAHAANRYGLNLLYSHCDVMTNLPVSGQNLIR